MNAADVEQFIASQNNKLTQKAYRSDLEKLSVWLGDREIETPSVAAEFRDWLTESYSLATALRVWSTCRTFFTWMRVDSPLLRVKGPQRITGWIPKVIPTSDEVTRLLDGATSNRDKAIIALMLNGLRVREVANLKVSDISYLPDYNRYVVNVIGKGMKIRLIPLSDEHSSYIIQERGHRDSDEPLIRNQSGTGISVRGLQWIVDKISREVGVGVYPHALRHYAATKWAREGVHIGVLQRLMGHSRADTSMVYLNLELSDLMEANK